MPAVGGTEGGGDTLQIRHPVGVEPELGYGDDHVGAAEAEPEERRDARVARRNGLGDEILARHTQLDAARLEEGRDLRGRQEGDRDAREAWNVALVAALGAEAADVEAGTREPRQRVLHEAALGREREGEGGHGATPASASNRSECMAAPTAGTDRGAPAASSNPS